MNIFANLSIDEHLGDGMRLLGNVSLDEMFSGSIVAFGAGFTDVYYIIKNKLITEYKPDSHSPNDDNGLWTKDYESYS